MGGPADAGMSGSPDAGKETAQKKKVLDKTKEGQITQNADKAKLQERLKEIDAKKAFREADKKDKSSTGDRHKEKENHKQDHNGGERHTRKDRAKEENKSDSAGKKATQTDNPGKSKTDTQIPRDASIPKDHPPPDKSFNRPAKFADEGISQSEYQKLLDSIHRWEPNPKDVPLGPPPELPPNYPTIGPPGMGPTIPLREVEEYRRARWEGLTVIEKSVGISALSAGYTYTNYERSGKPPSESLAAAKLVGAVSDLGGTLGTAAATKNKPETGVTLREPTIRTEGIKGRPPEKTQPETLDPKMLEKEGPRRDTITVTRPTKKIKNKERPSDQKPEKTTQKPEGEIKEGTIRPGEESIKTLHEANHTDNTDFNKREATVEQIIRGETNNTSSDINMTFEQFLKTKEHMPPTDFSPVVTAKTDLMRTWARDYQVPSEEVFYSPKILETGGRCFPSGQIALDTMAWKMDKFASIPQDVGAEAVFAHEAGHRVLGHSVLYTAKGIHTPISEEIKASEWGAQHTKNPEVRQALIDYDIPERESLLKDEQKQSKENARKDR